jgi:hypothetical protein
MPALPERPSLEYLKKLAKERLIALRTTSPGAKLAEVQLSIAREHGFPSWRALRAEIDRRRAPAIAAFFHACESGDAATARALLESDPSLVHERDASDNVTGLHVSAANGHLEIVRMLLDAGADVHGHGDAHEGGVIGWATQRGNEAVIDLLLERGARHHIFSAMATRDLELVEKLVDEDPRCLLRRRSSFEIRQTPLHAAFAPPEGLGYLSGEPDYAMLQRLIQLGADLEARDGRGRTPLDVALQRDDQEAVRILKAAGAREPREEPRRGGGTAAFAESVTKSVPMFFVPDLRATVQWYESIGFSVEDSHEDGRNLVFAELSFGGGRFALSPGKAPGPRNVSLWFFTDRVEDLYRSLKGQVAFEEDLYQPFYGGMQFSIRDTNGMDLVFWQPR